MKYICYYDIDDSENRKYILSAKNKIDYIVMVLGKCGYRTELVSVSNTKSTKHYSSRKEMLTTSASLQLFKTFGKKNIFTKILDVALIPLQLFIYLLLYTRKDEPVIVYHSLTYCIPVFLAKKIRHFKIILEMEEIYADVSGNQKQRLKEIWFSKQADEFIFPTQLLDEQINTNHKPAVIIHGTYQVESDRECRNDVWNLRGADSNDIHCVYAGTLDPRKGGAVAAAAAAKFLPGNYHIHILGFGSDVEIQNMKDSISQVASKSRAKVTYDGLLSGEDYIRFIQSCDIGLSTQNPDAAFNATSFPSKILSYMANGLRVVSIRIPAIEQSAVGDKLFYYDEQTSENIAKAILSVDVNQAYDSRKCIETLSVSFQKAIKELLENG